MNKLMNFLKTFAVGYIVELLNKNKDQLIKDANKKVDFRFLNEKQEADLMEAIYEVVIDVVEGIKK